MFVKAHHIDQITLLSAYMKHLSDVEFNKENSVNPFYMENWKLKTFSHFTQFLSRVSYQATTDWTPEHFQQHHFKQPEAISNQDQATSRLDETSWFCQHSAHTFQLLP